MSIETRSDWVWKLKLLKYADEEVEVILIMDMDLGGMSVTNDIESVIQALRADLPRPPAEFPIIYRDSMQNWDEVILDHVSRFKTFAALPRNKTLDFVAREAASRWATRRRDLPPAA